MGHALLLKISLSLTAQNQQAVTYSDMGDGLPRTVFA
jgi:hypothetical protein